VGVALPVVAPVLVPAASVAVQTVVALVALVAAAGVQTVVALVAAAGARIAVALAVVAVLAGNPVVALVVPVYYHQQGLAYQR